MLEQQDRRRQAASMSLFRAAYSPWIAFFSILFHEEWSWKCLNYRIVYLFVFAALLYILVQSLGKPYRQIEQNLMVNGTLKNLWSNSLISLLIGMHLGRILPPLIASQAKCLINWLPPSWIVMFSSTKTSC